ncbi:MAG: hypothetical protein KAT12_03640, partial [Gammaproteobacteria bacterium]|nr:hypothetical protein [Gammaproteobacteria bacterium]
ADGEAEMPAEAEPVQEEAAAEEVASPKIVPSPQIVTRPPADPLSQLLSDPILLAAAGGGLLLIIAVIALIIKRRKGAAETEAPVASAFDDFESLADEVAKDKAADAGEDEVEPLADETVVAGTDEPVNDDFSADSTMILEAAEDTVIAEESPATMDDEEPRDDVIAEADVYLAYGIYQQAEELLTQAITDNPERDDYRVKLAETHYASKNAEAFVEIAAEIKKRAGDEATPEWKKIMVMGQDLCADNPLFQGSMVGGLDVDALAPKAPEMDFDLGIDAAESAGEIEFDLSDAGAVEETPAKEDEFSLDIEASELDIDIQDEAEEPSPDEVHDIGDVDIDFGLDDDVTDSSDEEVAIDLTDEVESLDLDLDDEPSAGELTMDEPSVDESPAEEPVAIDIADEVESLDLDLDDEPSAGELTMDEPSVDESPAEEPVAIDIADDDDFDLSSLDDVDEISTKLDLARAYLDMGDNEGTRGILEEVIAEGNDEQKQEANELMAKLG